MNRREFIASLLAAAAVDPERLLWVPGRKKIFIPPPRPEIVVHSLMPNNPIYVVETFYRDGIKGPWMVRNEYFSDPARKVRAFNTIVRSVPFQPPIFLSSVLPVDLFAADRDASLKLSRYTWNFRGLAHRKPRGLRQRNLYGRYRRLTPDTRSGDRDVAFGAAIRAGAVKLGVLMAGTDG